MMTHDELLAKINSKLQFCTCDGWNNNCWEDENQPWKTLRAVVELHKPDWVQYDDGSGCLCNNAYPCATIEAIEKELA